MTETDATLEKLALELATPDPGLSRDQRIALMETRLGHLDWPDFEMVMQHSEVLLREQIGALMKENAILEALIREGEALIRRKGIL